MSILPLATTPVSYSASTIPSDSDVPLPIDVTLPATPVPTPGDSAFWTIVAIAVLVKVILNPSPKA